MYCGLDPPDALKLLCSAIRDGFTDSRRGKTQASVGLPLSEPIQEELTPAPAHSATTVCASTKGALEPDGFQHIRRRVRTKREKAEAIDLGLTLKGLRHAVAIILAENGHDERDIAAMLNQKTIEMARH